MPPASAAMAAGRGGPAHAEEPDDAAAQPGRVHGAPQPEVERAAERQAEPEAIETATITGGVGQTKSTSSEAAPSPRMSASWPRRARPEPAGEGAEQVGDERRRGERGEPERLEPAAPGDRREQRVDERQASRPTPTARRDRGRGCARSRAAVDGVEDGRPEHRVPRSSPLGLRGELSGSAWVRRRVIAICPEGTWVPRPR